MHFFSGNEKKKLIEQIILNNYNRYYRLAFSYARNAEDAGDIVQNGAYKALRNAYGLKNPEFAETWVYRIMLNECLHQLKQPKSISMDALEEENAAPLQCHTDHYRDIDLQRALDGLSPKEKAVVVLKYFEDKSLEEIAELLDENVNTVKTRLYRSMSKLQDLLSDRKSK
ncbi:MAG: RNA polymerase sigma factor [Lachnospiraceae bacterium]